MMTLHFLLDLNLHDANVNKFNIVGLKTLGLF